MQPAAARPQNTLSVVSSKSVTKCLNTSGKLVERICLSAETFSRNVMELAVCCMPNSTGQTQKLTFPVVCRIQFDIPSTSDGVQLSVTLRVYRSIDGSVRLSIPNLVTYSVSLYWYWYWYWYVQKRAIFMHFKTDLILTFAGSGRVSCRYWLSKFPVLAE